MNTIPTKINRYNVYNKGNRLLGVGEEMTLPDFEPSSETVTGAGILGEIDDPTVGYFGNQELEIPFRLLDKETADMMDMTKAVQLEIRGAQQTTNTEGDIEFRPMRLKLKSTIWYIYRPNGLNFYCIIYLAAGIFIPILIGTVTHRIFEFMKEHTLKSMQKKQSDR